jgi:hypothetical protein
MKKRVFLLRPSQKILKKPPPPEGDERGRKFDFSLLFLMLKIWFSQGSAGSIPVLVA